MWTRSEVNYVARFLWGIDANKVESDAMASQQG